jgi:site-specific recombinase XerD
MSDYKRYGRYWKEAFPGRTLAQITTGDVERYQAQRRKVAAPATVNREIKFLKRVFNVAKMDEKAIENPTDGVTLYKENNERVRWITDDEEARLKGAMRPT